MRQHLAVVPMSMDQDEHVIVATRAADRVSSRIAAMLRPVEDGASVADLSTERHDKLQRGT